MPRSLALASTWAAQPPLESQAPASSIQSVFLVTVRTDVRSPAARMQRTFGWEKSQRTHRHPLRPCRNGWRSSWTRLLYLGRSCSFGCRPATPGVHAWRRRYGGRHAGRAPPTAYPSALWEAASSERTQPFLLCGIVFLLPVIPIRGMVLLGVSPQGADRTSATTEFHLSTVVIFTPCLSVSVTGVRSAMSASRARCSSSSSPSKLRTRAIAPSPPSRLNRTSTCTARSGHCLRSAYMRSVIAVHAPSAEHSSSYGAGPASLPPSSGPSSALSS